MLRLTSTRFLSIAGPLGCHALLVTAPEEFRQKLFRRSKHRHVVYRAGKPVALVRRDQILHREAPIAQCNHNLIRLALIHTAIVGA